jgi:hypothetical protein
MRIDVEHPDPRLSCKFCFVNGGTVVMASRIAPQHSGGDEDKPAGWVPVCEAHYSDWYEEIDRDDRLPSFMVAADPIVLTRVQAEAVLARCSYYVDNDGEHADLDEATACVAIETQIKELES